MLIPLFTEPYNTAIARVVGSLAIHDPASLEYLITNFVVGELPSTQLSSLSLREIIDQAPNALYDLDLAPVAVGKILKNIASSSAPSIARPSREAKELLLEREPWATDAAVQARI